jgi:hypothetical protein
MNTKKKWQGMQGRLPDDPDNVLTRLQHWTIGSQRNMATQQYPEPCNLIAASAWHRIPPDMIATESFIYRDRRTGLWIQAVGTRLIPRDLVAAWLDLQQTGGAVATWTNLAAIPPRRQPTLSAKEIITTRLDPVTLAHQLNERGLYRIRGVDIRAWYPELFQGIDNIRVADYDEEGMLKLRKPKTTKLAEQSCGSSKCIETPLGVFASAKIAAEAAGIKPARVYLLAKHQRGGYRYITKQEYLAQAEINKSDRQLS